MVLGEDKGLSTEKQQHLATIIKRVCAHVPDESRLKVVARGVGDTRVRYEGAVSPRQQHRPRTVPTPPAR